jgi:hypothetical protein
MTDPVTTPQNSERHNYPPVSPHGSSAWTGWIRFAGIMLVVVGFFNVIDGLTAVFRNQVFVPVPSGVLVFDLTTWGWIHVVLGVVQIVIGGGVIAGQRWGLALGVLVAAVNAVTQIVNLPYFPLWALIVIALDCVVIYAIVVHGGEVREET